jgi:hypothetical protein
VRSCSIDDRSQCVNGVDVRTPTSFKIAKACRAEHMSGTRCPIERFQSPSMISRFYNLRSEPQDDAGCLWEMQDVR